MKNFTKATQQPLVQSKKDEFLYSPLFHCIYSEYIRRILKSSTNQKDIEKSLLQLGNYIGSRTFILFQYRNGIFNTKQQIYQPKEAIQLIQDQYFPYLFNHQALRIDKVKNQNTYYLVDKGSGFDECVSTGKQQMINQNYIVAGIIQQALQVMNIQSECSVITKDDLTYYVIKV